MVVSLNEEEHLKSGLWTTEGHQRYRIVLCQTGSWDWNHEGPGDHQRWAGLRQRRVGELVQGLSFWSGLGTSQDSPGGASLERPSPLLPPRPRN